MQLLGFHHLTAITANAGLNYRFYTQVLGMRLVKKTVNQDDISAYHLFYADGIASPGTDMTFFDWPTSAECKGTRSIIRTGFRVKNEQSLEFWKERFDSLGIPHSGTIQINGKATIQFSDPEGQRLSLNIDDVHGNANAWAKSPVPIVHQILGLGPITISVPNLGPTDRILTEVMGMNRAGEFEMTSYDDAPGASVVHSYSMGGGGTGAELHVAIQPDLARAIQGAGGVHHVAFRVPTKFEHALWTQRLIDFRVAASGPIDRYYFRSLYFREPNGILFELATDGPGFTADESLDRLGDKLALPPALEPQRAEIEAGLKPFN